jgi:hypothetical protein
MRSSERAIDLDVGFGIWDCDRGGGVVLIYVRLDLGRSQKSSLSRTQDCFGPPPVLLRLELRLFFKAQPVGNQSEPIQHLKAQLSFQHVPVSSKIVLKLKRHFKHVDEYVFTIM